MQESREKVSIFSDIWAFGTYQQGLTRVLKRLPARYLRQLFTAVAIDLPYRPITIRTGDGGSKFSGNS